MTSSQRILFVSRGSEIAGAQRQTLYAAAGLDRTRYEPIFVCREDGPFVEHLKDHGIRTIVLPLRSWRKAVCFFIRYYDAWRLYRFARQEGVSLVHCCDVHLSGHSLWAARRLGVPVIVHVRTTLNERELRKHNCHRATHLITISKRIHERLLAGGIDAGRVTRIDDAVDCRLYQPETGRSNEFKAAFGLSDETLIGIAGRIDPFKGQLLFAEAARLVLRRCGGVRFLIIGNIHDPGLPPAAYSLPPTA